MVRIGAITVGQSPRDDVIPEIKEVTGPQVEIVECGALDNLSLEEVGQFAPRPKEDILISRMRDGTPVTVSKSSIIPKMNECIKRLESFDVDVIAILCTDFFSELVSRKIILRPGKLLENLVKAVIEDGTLGVITPLKGQIPQMLEKWNRSGLNVVLGHCSPYSESANIEDVGFELEKKGVDLIVLDCMGYNIAMRRKIRDTTRKPVLLPRTVLARTIIELTA